VVIKIIVDVPYLDVEELKIAVKIINYTKPDFIKTSTGYAPRGTSVDDVKLIKKLLAGDIKIKAAGGIRTLDQVIELVNAGAERIGTSTAVDIIKEAMER
jgi:deoxyribose-phosphate aldolase